MLIRGLFQPIRSGLNIGFSPVKRWAWFCVAFLPFLDVKNRPLVPLRMTDEVPARRIPAHMCQKHPEDLPPGCRAMDSIVSVHVGQKVRPLVLA